MAAGHCTKQGSEPKTLRPLKPAKTNSFSFNCTSKCRFLFHIAIDPFVVLQGLLCKTEPYHDTTSLTDSKESRAWWRLYFRPNARNNNCSLQPFFDAVHYIKPTELLFEMWHLSCGFLLSYTWLHTGLPRVECSVCFSLLFWKARLQKGFFFYCFSVVFLFKLTGFSAVSVSDFLPNYLLCAAWHTFSFKNILHGAEWRGRFQDTSKVWRGGIMGILHHPFAQRPQ